ncbi:MAG: 30S ribosomal protein S12 methylthiotransferase RimO [Clostridiales bacterium]|nr:30S ribosomal protein S12 methylthiotransferase RimO [Clostridiales bacterium]
MTNVAVISLGCDKNRIDTEHMLYGISCGGYSVSDVSDADVIIVNTCAFIESARQESIDVILSCAELKKTGRLKKLIVTGCLPQKHLAELQAELPEVDAFLGAFEYNKLIDAIEGVGGDKPQDDFETAENGKRMLTTYPHTAYVKIAEGCDNHCTFCTIPSIRGGYRSRKVEDIVNEASSLVSDGVEEIILVAQDVTRFGEDKGENKLIELLSALEKLPLKYIRLLYCYPERVTDELIDKIASSDKIAKYIDIPAQHVSDRILKLMNRRTTGKYIEELVDKLHDRKIVVRTTLMVGFPGESEDDFNKLISFVENHSPEYAGVFAYSKEDGTAAARLTGHIKKADKLKRVKLLGKACALSTARFNASLVGKTIDVLYEDADFEKNLFVGRAPTQSPDVDGRVLFTAQNADVGRIYKVHIDSCDEYDLYGHVISGAEGDSSADEFTQ